MFKQYILVFDNLSVNRDTITHYLNSNSEIKNWLAFMSNAIIITTERDAHFLSELIHTEFESLNFFTTEIMDGKNNGWLNKDSWDFINKPAKA